MYQELHFMTYCVLSPVIVHRVLRKRWIKISGLDDA